MADKRPANKTYNTPRGTFKYPKLIEADTKFKEEGEYSVKLILDTNNPAVVKLMKLADEGAAASLEVARDKAKNAAERKKWETKYLPYAMIEDEETGEQTGEVEFKFTMTASGISKKTGKPWSRKPALFDAFGTPITKKGINIGGGTVGIISFQMIPYGPTTIVGASVKFALEAAQIITLKSFGERSASQYGFEAQDDGFNSSDVEDEDEDEVEDDDDADEDQPKGRTNSAGDLDDEIPF